MDCGDDSFTTFCYRGQKLDYLEGCGGIEAGCRFVQVDYVWVCYELDTDWCSFSFAPRDTFDECVADLDIAAIFEAKLLDEFVHTIGFLELRHIEF